MKALRYTLLLILCLMFSLVSQAQDTAVAEVGDSGLQVEYPEDWNVDTTPEDALLMLDDGNIFIDFYGPREADSAEDLLVNLMKDNGDAFDFGEIEETDLFNGEALRLDFTDGDYTGFSLALEYDGQLFVIDAYVADDSISRSEEATILEILETVQPTGNGSRNNSQDGGVAEWGDTGLQVEYPDGWDADTESDDAPLILSNGSIYMYFYEPRRASSPEDLLQDLMDDNADIFEFGDIESTDIFDGEALRADFTDGSYTGFSLALEYDGQMLLVDSYVEDDKLSRGEEADILDILATLEASGNSSRNNTQDEGVAEWGDTGLQVEYPDDWDADLNPEDALLYLSDGNIYMYFYEPRDADSLKDLLEGIIDNNSDSFDFGKIEATDLFDGEALRLDFANDEVTGFTLALEYDGQLLLVDAYVEDDNLSRSEEAAIFDILATLQPTD